MSKHLRLDIHSAPGHAVKVMADLGITYQHATPQSMGEQWWFWNCENVPDPLPPFLTPLDIAPRDAVGYGLSAELADWIAGGDPDGKAAISVITPRDREIFQRSNGFGLINLMGCISGPQPDSIEFQLYGHDNSVALAWRNTSAVIICNSWRAQVLVPEGGMYRINVRALADGVVLAESGIMPNVFGVGDIILSCSPGAWSNIFS